ncbi:MAG: hypothetical protein ACOX6N_03905 [Patescibacteria group bacterium]|jgi:hypothetical protein
MKTTKSLKRLFISSTRQKLINIFFTSPSELYYVRQLVRLTLEEINSVRRELDNLKKAGIIESEARGNRLYYWANKSSSLFNDLLVLAHKTSGLGMAIKDKENIGRVKMMLFSYNFLTNQPRSNDDVDIVLVGDISLREVESAIKKEEEKRGREINYMVMDKKELQLRKQKRDPFLIDFFLACPTVIIGTPQEIINI